MAFWNWFDSTAWYPLGRVVGGTLYPGLMLTSGLIHSVLHSLNIPIDIRNICVMLAPAFSGLTAYVTYKLTTEIKDERAGLLAAAFIGLAPGQTFFDPLHCHSSRSMNTYRRIHLPLCGWLLRQRSDCDLPSHVYVLPLDQSTQDWICTERSCDSFVLLLHGFCLGSVPPWNIINTRKRN